MSEYYNPNRIESWNYGGKNWKLPRSKIDLFSSCPRCFYIDNKLGVKRVPGFPFSINSAVDYFLKQEFDSYRVKNEQHPLQKEYRIDARPSKLCRKNSFLKCKVVFTYCILICIIKAYARENKSILERGSFQFFPP